MAPPVRTHLLSLIRDDLRIPSLSFFSSQVQCPSLSLGASLPRLGSACPVEKTKDQRRSATPSEPRRIERPAEWIASAGSRRHGLNIGGGIKVR